MIIKDPNPVLLDRAPATGEVGQAIKELVWILERDVNAGTQFLSWRLSNGQNHESWQTVACLMFRDVVENVDAAAELVRQRIDRPAMFIARAIFEHWLQIRYLTLEDQVERGRAYLFFSRLAELQAAEGVIKWAEHHRNDRSGVSKSMERSVQLAHKMLSDLQGAIETPSMAGVRDKYNSAKTKPKHWYSLGGGPAHLRKLAQAMDVEEYYLALYKSWSGVVHGEKSLDSFTVVADGLGEFAGLRNGGDLPGVTNAIHSMYIDCARVFVESLVPDRLNDFVNWYAMQGRSRLDWLSGLQFIPK